MGKVRIISGGNAGLYRVAPVYNDSLYQTRVAALHKIIDAADLALVELEEKRVDLALSLHQANQAVDVAINNYVDAVRDPDADAGPAREALRKTEEAVRNISVQMNEVMQQIGMQSIRRRQAITDMAGLNEHTEPAELNAWCADLTVDAAGEVASIEIPGEPQSLIIYPQVRGEGVVSPGHGQLMPRAWQIGYQAYFNAAILPGWQRWMPTHRVGTIITIDGDTCSVELDSETSSAQDLPIDVASVVGSVPIEYMDCNGAAFSLGDRVVVEFVGQDPAQRRVIGYESEPKPCGCQLDDRPWAGVPVVVPVAADFGRFGNGIATDGSDRWLMSVSPSSAPFDALNNQILYSGDNGSPFSMQAVSFPLSSSVAGVYMDEDVWIAFANDQGFSGLGSVRISVKQGVAGSWQPVTINGLLSATYLGVGGFAARMHTVIDDEPASIVVIPGVNNDTGRVRLAYSLDNCVTWSVTADGPVGMGSGVGRGVVCIGETILHPGRAGDQLGFTRWVWDGAGFSVDAFLALGDAVFGTDFVITMVSAATTIDGRTLLAASTQYSAFTSRDNGDTWHRRIPISAANIESVAINRDGCWRAAGDGRVIGGGMDPGDGVLLDDRPGRYYWSVAGSDAGTFIVAGDGECEADIESYDFCMALYGFWPCPESVFTCGAGSVIRSQAE